MVHVPEEGMATVLGFIGGEWLINRVLRQYGIPTTVKTYLKMLGGALIVYAGEGEDQFFIANIGIGLAAGGCYDYLKERGDLSGR